MSYNYSIPFVVRNGKEIYRDSVGGEHVFYTDCGIPTEKINLIEEEIQKKKTMFDDIDGLD